jgi:hypothetical protein
MMCTTKAKPERIPLNRVLVETALLSVAAFHAAFQGIMLYRALRDAARLDGVSL